MFDATEVSFDAVVPRLVSGCSAWVGHIPFAFTLMELLRPRIFVELGTYRGDSYCAFFQAVESLNLATRCTAVDTWRGDPSAGFYGRSVLAGLRAHHDPRYGGFSTLLRSTFDAAVRSFPEHSIDLLHIDGYHDYDSVRHDFETWRPRLSDSAVVLFHDTQVFTGNFGVHRLWRELAPCHRHFEFLHGYGLGVLAVGSELPAQFTQFLNEAGHSADSVREHYATLGRRIEERVVMGGASGAAARGGVAARARRFCGKLGSYCHWQARSAAHWASSLGKSPRR